MFWFVVILAIIIILFVFQRKKGGILGGSEFPTIDKGSIDDIYNNFEKILKDLQ